jgi:D-alanine-D-alanine ligase
LHDLKNFQANDLTQIAGVYETHLASSTAFKGLITPPLARGFFKKSKFKKLDVLFPTIHGSHGEDGTLQGLFEMVDLPYVGTGVMASAVANNKITTKAVLHQYGIPVVEGVGFTRHEWLQDDHRARIIAEIEALGYPVFVKPADLGSSIGIAKVEDRERLILHIDIAANFSRLVLVEKAVVGGIEVNCAVLGNHDIQVSVLEQPVSQDKFLTYEEKYMRGGKGAKGAVKQAGMASADRLIPAPLNEALTAQIQEYARRAFTAIGGQGTARLDFLAKPPENLVWLNEINTMPGSLAFYLWEATGKKTPQLCDELIQLGLERYEEKRRTTFDFKNPLIEHVINKGLSGAKK